MWGVLHTLREELLRASNGDVCHRPPKAAAIANYMNNHLSSTTLYRHGRGNIRDVVRIMGMSRILLSETLSHELGREDHASRSLHKIIFILNLTVIIDGLSYL
jgi:hypothetical protein